MVIIACSSIDLIVAEQSSMVMWPVSGALIEHSTESRRPEILPRGRVSDTWTRGHVDMRSSAGLYHGCMMIHFEWFGCGDGTYLKAGVWCSELFLLT